MNLRLLLFSCACTPMLCWGQMPERLSAELQAATRTVPAKELIPVIIALNDPVDREAVVRSTSSLRSADSRRETVMRQLSRTRSAGLDAVSSLLEAAARKNEAADVQKLVVGNLITCRVSASILQQLQQHAQVEWVDIDRETTLDIPESSSNPTPATRSVAPTTAWNVDLVEAPRVWNELGITGKGIVAAILDTGVDYNHPNLQGNLWQSTEHPHHGWDFVDNDNDPMDEDGHGTHCAGTIAGNRSGGISCGIAPEASLMIIRVLDKTGDGMLSNLFKGIDFAARNKAHLISASLGFGKLPYQTRNLARKVFDDLALLDIPAIIAAGNEGENVNGTPKIDADQIDNIPGCIPSPWIAPESPTHGGTSSVITVGSTDKNSIISSFSSAGPTFWEVAPYNDYLFAGGAMPGLIKPDIAAPGGKVLSLESKTTGYKEMSGTSMATPCVAGVVALLKQSNPNLSIVQIDRLLQNTATKHTQMKNSVYGSGIVNAYAVVSAAQLSVPTRLWIDVDKNECKLSWEAPDKKSGLTGYQLYGDDEKLAKIAASSCEYQFTKKKSHKKYRLTALYGTTESQASNSVSGDNEQLYAPFEILPSRVGLTNSVNLGLKTFYENASAIWGYKTKPRTFLNNDDINYFRTRFTPEMLSGLADRKLLCAEIVTGLKDGQEATVKLINGGEILFVKSVVIGQENISETIKIDFSSINDLFNPALETFVEVYTSEANIIKINDYPFCDKANYYSLDGKDWMEANLSDGNFLISLEFESPLLSSVATKHYHPDYNVYQNGVKINEHPFIGNNIRIDNVSEGTHTFAVSSTIDGRESALSSEVTFKMTSTPLLTPVPEIMKIQQQENDVLIEYKHEYEGTIMNKSVYQDGKYVNNGSLVSGNYLIKNVPLGKHQYILEVESLSKTARSSEKTFEVTDQWKSVDNLSATLSKDTALLKWKHTLALQHHDGSKALSPFQYPIKEKIHEYYVATRWSADKVNPVSGSQLRMLSLSLWGQLPIDSIHLYVYKNGQLCTDQKINKSYDSQRIIKLNEPVTVAKGDSLFVAFFVRANGQCGIAFDRSQTTCPENNLFSLDGVNWKPVSNYTTFEESTTQDWYMALLFGDEKNPIDPYAPLPTHYRVLRNGEFAGLLNGSATAFSEQLPSYGKYVYTVESIYQGAQVRTSNEAVVSFHPTSVERIESESSISVAGNEIIVSNAAGSGTLSVFDTEGKQMFTRAITEGYNAFQTRLSAGVYIVKLRVDQKEESIKALIR